MNVNAGTAIAENLEEFVDIQLRATLTFLVAARDDRSAGNVAAASREELSAHRAYQEALYLFRILRPHICQSGMQRLTLRIEEIDNAMRGS
ncbi:MAG TPA: hypothetical protein VFZ27_18845 [Terriglobia bacterium]|nr:hypothetical protein [Terriglobia bacterium]